MDTYFLPIQFLGPTRNGSNTAFLSAANFGSASSSQRSGKKESGSTKFRGRRQAALAGIPIRV